MQWVEDYRRKLCSAEQAVRIINSGDNVYYGGNAATPNGLINALAARAPELTGVQLYHVLLMGDDPLSRPEMAPHFRHNSLFVGPADREAVNAGRADYIPVFLHQIPRLFYERIVPLDVAMVMVSPPDDHGFMSYGVEVMNANAACTMAKKVIVQVNEHMPRVLGDSFIHVSRVAHIVEHSQPLPELKPRPISDVECRIGEHIRGMLTDGATIQMGIGGIPDAVWSMLDGLKDLGIHTEMLSDGAMNAIERGIVTGYRKTLHPGKVVITFALGTRDLYNFLDNNPVVEAHPVDHVNDPFVIGQNDNIVGINSAIEVDLSGQVCADSIGPKIYSGFGGQVDFIRGAARSRGGMPIIALPSTARNGQESRIVPMLKHGAGVVTTRADVHYVVTEHGVARLFGKNLRERAKALIGIADPKFRDELTRQARERKLL
ncbi:MAG TPA: acetyl-CoA hydrolase/transferase C-terminal domain-containing protein [bacterium]|nr:acetyl-CoA hydrolase/transferase C-terminal domain-containing protein [bacterium]